MTSPHDDRLNRLEQWLETYGKDRAVITCIRDVLVTEMDDATWLRIADALRDLANIVGVGLDDLETP